MCSSDLPVGRLAGDFKKAAEGRPQARAGQRVVLDDDDTNRLLTLHLIRARQVT